MLSNIDNLVGSIFGVLPSYKDGILHRVSGYTDNGKGTLAKNAPVDAPCKVQVDTLTQAQREAGFQEDDVNLIILLDGLDQYLGDARVVDDDTVEIPELNVTYRVSSPQVDTLKTHVSCRGRVKP